jgi:hypothetical protein
MGFSTQSFKLNSEAFLARLEWGVNFSTNPLRQARNHLPRRWKNGY